ncbi:transposable element Tcb1 transposase [Trichonephila clavipes]|nr:transposable element Tcb1 transposase [Trichonephila clavipes]
MRPLEDAGKKGWTTADFSIMMVAFNLGPQLIGSTAVRRRHSENCFATVPFEVPDLIFLQDNARPHTVCVAMNCLTACQKLPWPAKSPDLCQIELAWDMVRRRLNLPGNTDDLAQQ